MKRMELGSVSLDLVPGPDNPRNSEGAFLTLPDGEILYAYSRYKGESCSDEATTDLCLLRSLDDGRTFGEESTILTCEGEDGVNAMSLSMMHMENGDIGLFYLVRTSYTLLRMFLRRSRDGGRTWGERVLCTPQEGFFVVNNDRVIRLSSGRILIPAASHRSGLRGDMEEGSRFFDSRAEDMFFIPRMTAPPGSLRPGNAVCPTPAAVIPDCRSRELWNLRPDICGAGQEPIWGGSMKCFPWITVTPGPHASHPGLLRPTVP